MGVHIDTSQVDRLAVDLSRAPQRIQREAPRVMKRAAHNVADVMRRDASGHGHLPELQAFVGYDRTDTLGLGWRIGFAKEGQGNLANIAVFGSVNNFPVMDLNHGLRTETPRMLAHLGGAAEDAVLGGPE